jgi:hypothetical protein
MHPDVCSLQFWRHPPKKKKGGGVAVPRTMWASKGMKQELHTKQYCASSFPKKMSEIKMTNDLVISCQQRIGHRISTFAHEHMCTTQS